MPNVNAVLNEQIRRLARREIHGALRTVKKITARYRRDIAGLKRQHVQVTKELRSLKQSMPDHPPVASGDKLRNARLRIDGLKTHRAKLGLSAKDYGRLLGVSGLTVYNWENGKSKPRRSQLPRIVAVRGLGKRAVLQRLQSSKK